MTYPLITRNYSIRPPTGNFPFFIYNLDQTIFRGILYYKKDISLLQGCSETTFRRKTLNINGIQSGSYKDSYFTQVPIPLTEASPLSLSSSWKTFHDEDFAPVIEGTITYKFPYFVYNAERTLFIGKLFSGPDVKQILGISNTYLLKRFESSPDGFSITYKDFFITRKLLNLEVDSPWAASWEQWKFNTFNQAAANNPNLPNIPLLYPNLPILGLILGDAYLPRLSATKKSSKNLLQGTGGKASPYYINFLYENFSRENVSISDLKLQIRKPDQRTGNIYSAYRFNTRSDIYWGELREIFYTEIKPGVIKKIVPLNIVKFFTANDQAALIMDDGSFNGGQEINLQDFRLQDLEVLSDALNYKFDLSSYPRKVNDRGQFIIYIPRHDLELLQSIVEPYKIKEKLYKIQ